MDYKVLYRKYRPDDFSKIIGQSYTTNLLINAIKENKIAHAYIFTGPRGTGKTTTARVFAKAINCTDLKDGNPCNKCENCLSFGDNPDIIEIDAASNNGVDEIRELINNVKLSPSNLKYKVYIIDEFHMLSTSAFNALLLTLEDPPSNVVFILATTDIQNVPVTILSRCQRFDFKLITFDDLFKTLKNVSKEEKIKITDDALKEIAYLSNGGLRDALSYLDQISSQSDKIDADDVTNLFGGVSTKRIDELIDMFSNGDVDKLIELITNIKDDGVNYYVLVNKLINSFKNILIDIRTNRYNGNLLFDNVYNITMDLSNFLTKSKNNIDPYSVLEIILLKYVCNEPVSSENVKVINNLNKEKEEVKEEIIEDVPGNVDREIKEETAIEVNDTNNELVEDENKEKSVSEEDDLTFNIKVRVNNCFVNAKKDFLNNVKEKWEDFVIYEKNVNKKLSSYIIDTDIVAMSDSYGILMNNNDTTVDLINENIKNIENDFRNFYGIESKFAALSNKEWETSKQEYVNNLKKGVKYSIIEEKLVNSLDTSNDQALEDLANEIFGSSVEIR